MEKLPKVSVIIPLYNKAAYVKEAIDSILAQTFCDFEIIIVDDASSDGGAEIVKTINDSRIRFYQNTENLGTAATANKLIRLSRGEYIIRLDADDIAPKDRLRLQVEFMDKHPNIGVSSGYIQCFGSDKNLWKVPLSDKEIKAGYLFTVPICQGASIIRKEVLINNNIEYNDISKYIGEDRVLWFRLRNITDFGNIDKVLLYYRRGEQNIARDTRFDKVQIRKKIYSFFFKELEIEVNEEELNIHSFNDKIYDSGFTSDNIKHYHKWLDKLLRINNERNLFPVKEFENYTKQAWDQLFYRLVSGMPELIPLYRDLSGGLTLSQIKYLAKYKINKLLGRK